MNNLETSSVSILSLASADEILTTNLHRLMQKENLSEAELARRAKLPQPTVHKVLSGKTIDPRISTLQAIATYFNISVDALYSTSFTFSEKEKAELPIQSIPIISWEECIKGKSFLTTLTPNNWNQWVVVEHQGKNLFGLATKPSMEPKLTRGSLLIIDPQATPRDGDIVVVHYSNTPEATLREIIIDGPSRCLKSIQDMADKSSEALTENVLILGCVIELRFGF